MAWYLVRKFKATGMKSKRVVSLGVFRPDHFIIVY